MPKYLVAYATDAPHYVRGVDPVADDITDVPTLPTGYSGVLVTDLPVEQIDIFERTDSVWDTTDEEIKEYTDLDALLKNCYKQNDSWLAESAKYDSVIHDLVASWISSTEQGANIVYQSLTISRDIKIKWLTNYPKGAADINSVEAFVNAVDQFSVAPTTVVAYISTTTGEQLNLANAENAGVLDADYEFYADRLNV